MFADMVMATPEFTPLALLRLLDGFRGTKALTAAVRLGVFDLLASEGTLSALACAQRLKLEERPARMLLTACTALGLLDFDGYGFANSSSADEFLVRSRPLYFGDFVLLVDEEQYQPWGDLVAALQENRPVVWAPQAEKRFPADRADIEPLFWNGMSSVSAFTAHAVSRSFDFSGFRSLLDVGGGRGDFSIELCMHQPRLRATVYDLPSVCRLTERKVAASGLSDRIGAQAGDLLLDDELPAGHDLILLSNVLHMWDEATVVKALRKCLTALNDGGALVVAEAFVDDDGTGPVGAALMSLNMLVHTAGGRNYTRREYEAWLTAAGFSAICRVPLIVDAPGANGLVIGRK